MNKTEFKTIGIIGKYGDSDISSSLNSTLDLLQHHNINILLDENTIKNHSSIINATLCSTDKLAEQSDLIITIGGDGSFLASSRSIIDYKKPIIGINMGRLGFLTDISPNDISQTLNEVLLGQYTHEKRTVIYAEIVRNGKIISHNIAINDVVIHKTYVARMIELDVYLNDTFLSSYRADGLIISSPTGSTAYALSSGGPILQGDLEALILVPICPHTLTQRPIVIDANTKQRIEIPEQKDANLQVTIDGQEEITLEPGDIINISKHKNKLSIYHPCNYDSLERLRKKLSWGTVPES